MLMYESIQELTDAAVSAGQKISGLVLRDQAEQLEKSAEDRKSVM